MLILCSKVRVNMKTRIIYEDNDILVCIKPAGFAVQSAHISSGDMESELKSYLRKTTGSPYLGIVHRLDQPVGGVMVFAKNDRAAASLSRQVQSGSGKTMGKYYEALVLGSDISDKEVLVDYMVKDNKTNTSRVTSSNDKQAKKASLSYKVLERYEDGYARIGVQLSTGRHHQIRVQMAHAGHPLLGDQKYGNDQSMELSEKLGLKNVQLRATRLEFIHPSTNKKMVFDDKSVS